MSRNQQLSNDDDLRLRFVRESAVLRDGLQDGKPFHSVKEFSHFLGTVQNTRRNRDGVALCVPKPIVFLKGLQNVAYSASCSADYEGKTHLLAALGGTIEGTCPSGCFRATAIGHEKHQAHCAVRVTGCELLTDFSSAAVSRRQDKPGNEVGARNRVKRLTQIRLENDSCRKCSTLDGRIIGYDDANSRADASATAYSHALARTRIDSAERRADPLMARTSNSRALGRSIRCMVYTEVNN